MLNIIFPKNSSFIFRLCKRSNESWVENVLIKELKSGKVVMMDNASFYKSKKTKELIESVNCRIIFLPPYSPDLNPIGKFWANMKCWIKNQITEFDQLYEAISLKYLIQSKLL
ncbi:IS630 family transposase domain protein [Rickettsiales endosymbiont of Paramecium tredecaurelia]|nr:IS630 family transposase domain protein [Candidatus Sarmatiella mevalonica]